MRISILIPAFNEAKLIAASLAEVKRASGSFAARGWETELIVCDNNSTDQTGELARAAGAKVVFEPINRIAGARNKGAEAATGDWLVFVDADSHPSRELFADVASQIESRRVLAGGSTVRLDAKSFAAAFGNVVWNLLSRGLRLMAGSFIFCEAAAFHEVGGFSQELFAGEELDLAAKLKKLARRRRKKIVILHGHPLLTSARKLYLYGRGEHLRFFLKAAFRRQRVLTSREACHTWYDGRR